MSARWDTNINTTVEQQFYIKTVDYKIKKIIQETEDKFVSEMFNFVRT